MKLISIILIFLIIVILFALIMVIKKIPTKIEDEFNKKKIRIIILLLSCIVMAMIFLYITADSNHYKINIERIYSNSNEREAIQKAEELDLATILNVTRYSGWIESSTTNNPPESATAYVWPNLVDKEALDYYQNKIKRLEKNQVSVDAHMDYVAICDGYDEVNIRYNHHNREIVIDNMSYFISFTDKPLRTRNYSHCAISINNSLEIISLNTHSVQFNLSTGYIVSQEFDHRELYGPLAAYGGGAEQIIVLDQNYLPHLILSRPTGGWIS